MDDDKAQVAAGLTAIKPWPWRGRVWPCAACHGLVGTRVRAAARATMALLLPEALMTEFYIPDMSCTHCVAAITRAVQTLDPAAQVHADLPARRVSVDSARPAEALRQALEDAGYPPKAGDSPG